MSNTQITDTEIEQLQIEAGEVGDQAQATICDQALAGDPLARTECARVIANAAAQGDDQ